MKFIIQAESRGSGFESINQSINQLFNQQTNKLMTVPSVVPKQTKPLTYPLSTINCYLLKIALTGSHLLRRALIGSTKDRTGRMMLDTENSTGRMMLSTEDRTGRVMHLLKIARGR